MSGGETVSIATNEVAAVSERRGYPQLFTRIRAGDTSAMERLYEALRPRLWRLISRSLGWQDADDVVNDTFCTAFRMIQSGAVREPERLRGYVLGIARIQILNCIRSRVACRARESGLGLAGEAMDRQPGPEEQAQMNESRAVAREALGGLRERQREVLVRHLKGQRPEAICRDMSLTPTQFRVLKTQAKSRFGQMGKRILGGISGNAG